MEAAPPIRDGSSTPSISTKPGRLGMGLAIVRSVVKSHGGRVWAESATGRGTTIYLSLPRDGPSP
ncbi:MAG: cell wall metabolism sensor histidine kinase WalK [Rhodopseudomonas palustris]|nr:cell wall metabolism sensor histidine kinase WalK [Rhodopseudomonas palustris]